MNKNEYIFNIVPMGAVRMNYSDRWKQRPEVSRYLAFKKKLTYEANRQGYKIGNRIAIVFYIPMPASWSKTKKDKMRNTPHTVKPDLDNLIKAFFDALTHNDAYIYEIHARKFWGDIGCIKVFTLDNI